MLGWGWLGFMLGMVRVGLGLGFVLGLGLARVGLGLGFMLGLGMVRVGLGLGFVLGLELVRVGLGFVLDGLELRFVWGWVKD